MPEPTKIPRAFAASGDKNSIPDSSGSPGFASWQEGFPAITSEPFAQGGIAPKRADFNGIFNALSAATVWNQQGGVYAYDATTDYEIGNVVLYSGDIYKCLSANGPSSAVKDPTDTTVWAKVILTTATTSAAGYMSAADKTILDSVTGITSYSNSVDYAVGSVVSYSGTNYAAVSANGPGTTVAAPTDQSKWLPLYGIFSDNTGWPYLSFGPYAVYFGQCWTTSDSPTTYSFPYPFASAPVVFLSFISTSGAPAQMRVTSVTTTDFSFDYINNGTHVSGASAYFCALGFK